MTYEHIRDPERRQELANLFRKLRLYIKMCRADRNEGYMSPAKRDSLGREILHTRKQIKELREIWAYCSPNRRGTNDSLRKIQRERLKRPRLATLEP